MGNAPCLMALKKKERKKKIYMYTYIVSAQITMLREQIIFLALNRIVNTIKKRNLPVAEVESTTNYC